MLGLADWRWPLTARSFETVTNKWKETNLMRKGTRNPTTLSATAFWRYFEMRLPSGILLTHLALRTRSSVHKASSILADPAMRGPRFEFALALVAAAAFSTNVFPQQAARSLSQTDSSYVDAQGTAYIYRIVPMPQTVSPQAQHYLLRPLAHPPERRQRCRKSRLDRRDARP